MAWGWNGRADRANVALEAEIHRLHGAKDKVETMANTNSLTPDGGAAESLPAGTMEPRRRFPWWMTLFSLFSLTAIVVLRFGYESLNEWINLNPGVARVISLILVFLVVCGWNIWIAFFSRWRWVSRLIGVSLLGILPILGLVFFQIIFDGDLGIVRVEPRFSAWERQYAPVQEASASDEPVENLDRSTEFDFPQFLGPDRNATITNVELANSWEAQAPETVWTNSVGEGWSGFSIVGDHAFTQEQRDDQELVVCYDVESGAQVWAYSATRRHEDLAAVGRVGPRATPAVSDGRVYTMSGTGVLDCLDAKTGEHAWAVDVTALVNIEQVSRVNSRGLEYTQENSTLTWGRSGSPLVFNGIVIVPAGGPVGGDAVTMLSLIHI